MSVNTTRGSVTPGTLQFEEEGADAVRLAWGNPPPLVTLEAELLQRGNRQLRALWQPSVQPEQYAANLLVGDVAPAVSDGYVVVDCATRLLPPLHRQRHCFACFRLPIH